MWSPNRAHSQNQNSRLATIALLVAIGLILFVIESLIPRPLPWLKLGFAHIATLVALYWLDGKAALLVVILRVILGSLVLGTIFNPSFFISFTAGVVATTAMIFCKTYFGNLFSIFGISIIGAVFHNITQLAVANWLIINKSEIFYLIPIMVLTALFTGLIIALTSYFLLSRIALEPKYDEIKAH